MGNESSQFSGLEIKDKPLEITDFWAHYQATVRDSCRYFGLRDGSISVFKGEPALGPLWVTCTPLEKCSNNLLIYRHPCILRYLSAWQQRSTHHLATEYVQPLSLVLDMQTPLQKCIGLNNILRALVFLHNQAEMSHNNVSVSSVYVTDDGHWKLGGLQYLCPIKDLNAAYLRQARINRYDKAVDPNEDSNEFLGTIDQYGFAILVEDVFKGNKDDDVPHLKEFKKYCHDLVQHNNPAKRPPLSEVIEHDFFNHEFMLIYKFLYFFAIKTGDEKKQFFSSVMEQLRCFDETTIAKQLGGLLLSRLVMLDQIARKEVIPYILQPRNGRMHNDDHPGLFNVAVYKEHIKPRIIQLFGVRDTQIRLLLLAHFSKFACVFTHEELSQHILPELLLGIRDTDDNLVSSTLACLSEIVPILGAATVIGGKRNKIFIDGKPNLRTNSENTEMNRPLKTDLLDNKPLSDFHCTEELNHNDSTDFDNASLILHERPSPVGGESIEEEIYPTVLDQINLNCNEEHWSDWDNPDHMLHREVTHIDLDDVLNRESLPLNNELTTSNTLRNEDNHKNDEEKTKSRTSMLHNAAIKAKKNIIDITELDIKNQKNDPSKKSSSDEFDFFADMTPVIEKPAVASVDPIKDSSNGLSSKLNFTPDDETVENSAWDED